MSFALSLDADCCDRLSRIETVWAVIHDAHADGETVRGLAQHELLVRYGEAVRRYLLGALRDDAAAEETFQEFAIRLLRGDYRSANPDKGRFRGFLKVVLSRLVADHYRKLSRRKETTLDAEFDVGDDSEVQDREQAFVNVWRDEMLTQAWEGLANEERRTGKPWMTLLRMRVEHPKLRSIELAQRMEEAASEPFTATRLRVMLHRSREKFAGFLIDAVAQSLSDPHPDAIEEELAELHLLEYCQSVLQQRQ
ncbi:MAG: sigma-70 family RNA polymerase sigma factor [Planctomycetota bacterium]